jgi:hypothetical protein
MDKDLVVFTPDHLNSNQGTIRFPPTELYHTVRALENDLDFLNLYLSYFSQELAGF